jgi:GxxExxY protein
MKLTLSLTRPLKKTYTSDLTYYEKISVELKAIDRLTEKDIAQLLNYLKATSLRPGLLINFGNAEKPEWERRVR